MTQLDPRASQDAMVREVEERLPDFAKMCAKVEADSVLMHQAAFAADYQVDEFMLLGMAIKYAGLKGKNVTIIEHS